MIKDISLLNWCVLFVIYFVFDALYTRYIIAISKCEALKTANLSVLILMLGIYGTVNYVDNYYNVVPIIAGCWIGSFCSLKFWKGKK